MYKENLKHILKHKWFVMIECFKVGLFWHGITHDMSKLLPSEFVGYAENFFGDKLDLACMARLKYNCTCNEELPTGSLPEDKFAKAWILHQHRNPHHWEYWVNAKGKAVPMPLKNVRQMVCDWNAMSRQFGGTALEFFNKNCHKMKLHGITSASVKGLL